MRVRIPIALLCAVCLFACSPACAADDFQETLAQARTLVEQKSYDTALEFYSRISDAARRDAGLLIEWARVYTYADKHDEAIRLFEELRSRFPERAQEIFRELADQYAWSGRAAEAVGIYRAALDADKESTQLMLGLAEALSYNDQLEEAYALYQKVLDKEPDNISALNSQARVLVWQGYHRRGIARYEEILQKHPDDLDAIEGIGFAWHWLGDDLQAQRRLKDLLERDPNRTEAKKLYYQIQNARMPFVSTSGRYATDSTPQSVLSQGVRLGARPDIRTRVNGIYEYQTLHKKGTPVPDIAAQRLGLGAGRKLSEDLVANAYFYKTYFSKVDFNPITANVWLTCAPDDYWRMDLSYARETFEDNDALRKRIVTNSPGLSVDFRPDRFWFFNAQYKRGFYSDDNTQDQWQAKAEYRISHKPFVKLYYNYYYCAYGEPELNNGYFNPRSIRAHALGVYSGRDISSKLFVEAKASGGYEFQRKSDTQHKKSDHPTAYCQASVNYRLTDNWLVSVSGDYFTTWPDHGQRSYQKRGVFLSITYNFGLAGAPERDATRASRTTGASQ